MKVIHLSDTHGLHRQIKDMPEADVIVHSGDFTEDGTEAEVLDFLNWFIGLPHGEKIFVAGNHDLCLRDARAIENLPENVHFLQDKGITIDGVRFFGLGYDHLEGLIPEVVDVLVTHEPPCEILDFSSGTHWGNLSLRRRVETVRPRYHLFGHAHEAYGITKHRDVTFANASLLNDDGQIVHEPRLLKTDI